MVHETEDPCPYIGWAGHERNRVFNSIMGRILCRGPTSGVVRCPRDDFIIAELGISRTGLYLVSKNFKEKYKEKMKRKEKKSKK